MENITDPPLPAPTHHTQSASLLQSIEAFPKSGVVPVVTLYPITQGPSSLPSGLIEYLHEEFSAEILKGCTYPMEEPMSLERFRDYWFGTFAVVVLKGTRQETESLLKGDGRGVGWKDVCLGTFYVKPNYPGIMGAPLLCTAPLLIRLDCVLMSDNGRTLFTHLQRRLHNLLRRARERNRLRNGRDISRLRSQTGLSFFLPLLVSPNPFLVPVLSRDCAGI